MDHHYIISLAQPLLLFFTSREQILFTITIDIYQTHIAGIQTHYSFVASSWSPLLAGHTNTGIKKTPHHAGRQLRSFTTGGTSTNCKAHDQINHCFLLLNGRKTTIVETLWIGAVTTINDVNRSQHVTIVPFTWLFKSCLEIILDTSWISVTTTKNRVWSECVPETVVVS